MAPQPQQGQQQGQQQQHQQLASFAGVPAGHQQQQQPSPANDNPTLPPLQQQTHSYSHLPPLYTGGQHPGGPHTPHTPGVNSAMSHGSSNFSGMHNPVTTGSMPPPSTSYMSGPPGYATSHAPPLSAGRLQDIRPMPSNGGYTSPLTPFPAFNPATPMPGQPPHQYIPSQEPEPIHVVGSQGRRGILPSVPGRPPVSNSVASAAAKSMIPQKDEEGKFPCPHCHKTYLHAKHLKRHLLRHTGDRPYTCHLCKDTFSRSDILKRHFQKCSIRRGNPTGANHLAGQRRNTTSSVHRMSVGNGDGVGLPGLSENNSASYPNTVNGSPTVNGDHSSYASSIASMSARSSRANSLIQPPLAYNDGRHLAGLGVATLPSSGQHQDGHPTTSGGYAGGLPAYAMRPHSASNPVHPSNYGYGPPTSNGNMYSSIKSEDHGVNNYTASAGPVHGMRGPSQGNMDWNMFGTHGQEGFVSQGQQDQSQQNPRAEHHIEGQQFNHTEPYNANFLNGMHTQGHSYGDEGVHHHGLVVSR